MGASWRVTVTRQGQWELDATNALGATTTTITPWSMSPPTVASTVLPGCTVGYIGTGTLTVTADWVDMMGLPAPNPPAKVGVLLTCTSQWACVSSLMLFEHEAQDGWPEDPEVLSTAGGTEVGQSYGKHLVTFDGATGHVQRTIAMACRAKAHAQETSGVVSATIDLSVVVDTRTACITASIDPTYHRELNAQGQPVRVANRQDPSSTASFGDRLRAELAAGPSVTVTYMAGLAGGWAPNSAYHWYDSATDQVSQGTFTLPTPAPAPMISSYGWLNGSATAHVHLRITDSATPDVQCTANYWLRFHQPHEDWVRTTTVAKPRSIVQYPSDWPVCALICDNPTGATLRFHSDHDATVSSTMAGSFATSIGLTLDSLSLSSNESISVGETRSDTLLTGYGVDGAPYQRIEVWVGMMTEDRTGTASIWDEHGYLQDTTWQGTWVSGHLTLGTRLDRVYPH